MRLPKGRMFHIFRVAALNVLKNHFRSVAVQKYGNEANKREAANSQLLESVQKMVRELKTDAPIVLDEASQALVKLEMFHWLTRESGRCFGIDSPEESWVKKHVAVNRITEQRLEKGLKEFLEPRDNKLSIRSCEDIAWELQYRYLN